MIWVEVYSEEERIHSYKKPGQGVLVLCLVEYSRELLRRSQLLIFCADLLRQVKHDEISKPYQIIKIRICIFLQNFILFKAKYLRQTLY